MTVTAYVGNTGSGKTSNVVERVIIPALKAGRVVFHNLTLHEEPLRILAGGEGKLIAFDRKESTPDQIVTNAPAGCVVVIDESWRYWRNGIKSSTVPTNQFEFFAMHRHSVGPDGKSMDIVIIAQDLGTGCPEFIRALVATTFMSVAHLHFGLRSTYSLKVYRGPVKGDAPPKSKLIRSIACKRNPAIFNCYVSHTESDTGEAGDEVTQDDRGNAFKSLRARSMIFAVIGLPFVIWGAAASIHAFRHKFEKPAAAPEHGESATAVGRSAGPQAPSKPAEPETSKDWRYAGKIVVDGEERFILDGGDVGGRILEPAFCQHDNERQVFCKLDGKVITAWSGPPPPILNQIFTAPSPAVASR